MVYVSKKVGNESGTEQACKTDGSIHKIMGEQNEDDMKYKRYKVQKAGEKRVWEEPEENSR